MSITCGRLHQVDIKINISFERRSPSTSDRGLSARMDLESITLYLAMKHLGALEIHAEINSVLEQGTVGHSSITRYLQRRRFPRSSESAEEEPEIGSCDPIDRAILQALNVQAFPPFNNLRRRH
jgi:hypothetical protein